MSVDGSITIDTRISPTGFNAGMKKLQSSALTALNAILLPVVRIGEKIKSVLLGSIAGAAQGIQAAIGAAFVIFALSISKIFAFLRESIQDAMLLNPAVKRQWEELQNGFVELKSAIGNAFLPLVQAAIPYIKQTIAWLIELFNKAAMYTAALMGQKQALQIIQGSAQKIADANKKTEKAARGQLAAFDQISLLQLPESEAETDIGDMPKVASELVPVTDEILSKVQAIKEEIAEWFADPIGKLQETWGKVKDWFKANVIDPIATWWQDSWLNKNIVEPLKNSFLEEWEDLKRGWKRTTDFLKNEWDTIRPHLMSIWEFIKQDFALLNDSKQRAWHRTKEFLENEWNDLKDFGSNVWQFIKDDFANLGEFFKNTWQRIKDFAVNAWKTIQDIWANAGAWFNAHVVDPIRDAFQRAADWIRDNFGNAFSNIGDIARDAFNGMINLINGLLSRIANSINNMASILNQFSWMMGGFSIPTVDAPQIPHLASGAVIPPNAEFLAVLGDQRSGKNIEAPAKMFEDMLKRAVEGANGGEMTITMPVYLDNELIYKGQQKVSRQHGKNLLAGGNV